MFALCSQKLAEHSKTLLSLYLHHSLARADTTIFTAIPII
jgi:hypothetical protein